MKTTLVKLDDSYTTEEAIERVLVARKADGVGVPSAVTVDVDAFTEMVGRLGARVFREVSPLGEGPPFFELWTSAGAPTRVYGAAVPHGEMLLNAPSGGQR